MIIAHASELLSIDETGFVHAVALGAAGGSAVRGIHVRSGAELAQVPPPASLLLERWGRPGVVDHRWSMVDPADDPADALLGAIAALQADLIVASTHARGGFPRLLLGSVAEGMARNVRVPVLLLPTPGPSLVSAESGAVALARALLLAGSREDTERAMEGLVLLARLAATARCDLELLHIEDGTSAPAVSVPAAFHATVQRSRGPIERAVSERVRQVRPDLLVMTSHGHDRLSDVIFASHTERVLHETRVPLLWVPAEHAS